MSTPLSDSDLDDLMGSFTTAKDLAPPSPKNLKTVDEGEKKENDGKSSSSGGVAVTTTEGDGSGVLKQGTEESVSTVLWSTWGSTITAVSDTFNITDPTTDTSKEKSDGEIRLSDADLDAMMITEKPETDETPQQVEKVSSSTTEDQETPPTSSSSDKTAASTSISNEIAAAESAVSTAFWSTVTSVSDGINTAATAATAAATTTPTNDTTLSDDQPKDSSSFISNDIKAAETAVSSALWSTFNSVSDTLNTTANTLNNTVANISATNNNEEQANGTEQQQQQSSPAGNIWSTLSAVSEKTLGGSTTAMISESTSNTASSIYKLYNEKVNRASGWIDNLEREKNEKDPHKRIRNHLEQYISTNPDNATYEQWIGLWLSQEGWDDEDKNENDDGATDTAKTATAPIKVDKTYYAKDSVHRNMWNERNYADGIDIHDKNPKRAYVNIGNVNTVDAAMATEQEQQIDKEGEEYVIEFGNNDEAAVNDTIINPTKDGLGEIGVSEN